MAKVARSDFARMTAAEIDAIHRYLNDPQ